MITLPPIPLEKPVKIPAVPERIFTRALITDLSITVRGDVAAGAIRVAPISDDGETTDVGAEAHRFGLYEAAAQIPSAAAALAAVIQCTPELLAWCRDKEGAQ